MSEQRSSFGGWITPTMNLMRSHLKVWLSMVFKYVFWNHSWYRLWFPNRTCDVRNTNFFSMSGVILDCKKRLEVLIFINCDTPVKVIEKLVGLYRMSFHNSSISGILDIFCNSLNKSLPITRTSLNRSRE